MNKLILMLHSPEIMNILRNISIPEIITDCRMATFVMNFDFKYIVWQILLV